MPHLESTIKHALDHELVSPSAAGHLNYKFTDLITDYIQQKGLCYQTINDVLGALEGAKLEFYSLVARPYEDKKIKTNGNAYPKELL